MRLKQISPATIIVSLMAASLPLSYYSFSISIILLFLYWLFQNNFNSQSSRSTNAEKNFRLRFITNLHEKLICFFNNRIALIISSIYLLYVVGSLWSSNTHFIAQELRIKLPFLLLPVLFSGLHTFSKKEFHIILLTYCLAVFAGSLISFSIYLIQPISDTRELSPFMPHIRFSLNVCMAVIILFYLLFKESHLSLATRASLFILFTWLIIFLFILKSITGISLLSIFFVVQIAHLAWYSQHLAIKISSRILLISIPLLLLFYAFWFNNNYLNIAPVNLQVLDQKTINGNPYTHDTTQYGIECGRYVGLYICETELKEAWKKRSKRPYGSIDKNGNELRVTLFRYLNTRDLRKDANGLGQLCQKDIQNIENGIANEGLIKPFNLTSRIDNFFMGLHEYRQTGNANGKSELQRIEYYKATFHIIRNNWIAGVGTGDVDDAFSETYKLMHSKLDMKHRGSSHNQYLYMGVAFGIPGILLFITWLLSLLFYKRAYTDFLFSAFFFIMAASMLTEDTIRHQAGVNYCIFFIVLLLITRPVVPKQQKCIEH